METTLIGALEVLAIGAGENVQMYAAGECAQGACAVLAAGGHELRNVIAAR